jgi:hypothetical protein
MLLFLYRAGCLFAHQQKTRKTTQWNIYYQQRFNWPRKSSMESVVPEELGFAPCQPSHR